MSQDATQHLVKMANEIALNSPRQEEQLAADFVLSHLRRFWAPSMLQQLADYAANGSDDLQPAVKKALQRLTQSAKAPPKPNGT